MGSIFRRVTARRVSRHRNGRASLVGQAREKPEQRATRLQQRDPEPQRRVVDLCGRRRRVRGAPSAYVPGRRARARGRGGVRSREGRCILSLPYLRRVLRLSMYFTFSVFRCTASYGIATANSQTMRAI
jgi:hypothetical protein